MTSITWDPAAQDFMRKLPRQLSCRLFKKFEKDIMPNVVRFLETLAGRDGYKIRVGDYRFFVDYYWNQDRLVVRSVRHRRNAYKRG